jgi:hypothetical protein
MVMNEFQVVTRDEAAAERFMAAVQAEDVSIEDWSGVWPGEEYDNYVCSFGLTPISPKKLNRVADFLGVALIYVEQD